MVTSPVNWFVESLRCSVFSIEELEPQQFLDAWERLMQAPPDETAIKERQQLVTVEGAFEPGRLHVEIRPRRIDWRLRPGVDDGTRTYPLLGAYNEVEEPFTDKMQEWLRRACPPVHRLAYGVVLVLPADDIAAANRQLDDLVQSVRLLAPDSSRDLEFRVNMRRNSQRVEELPVNRLAKWSAIELQRLEISQDIGQRVGSWKSEPMCRLELDVNSAPEHVDVLRDTLPLFEELVAFANEISKEGDVS